MNIKWHDEHQEKMTVNEKKGVTYLTYPQFDSMKEYVHCFSTRLGGVSEGIYQSMNLSFTRGDKEEAVMENYRRMGDALGFLPENIVTSDQTHTTIVRTAEEGDRGCGVTKPREFHEVDGMVTNIPGIVLATFYADCVPLYFADTKNKVIGLAHSGWRGTVNKMGEVMLKKMHDVYGTEPEDVYAAIGPSICQECYEVGSEVADVFHQSFPAQWQKMLKNGCREGKYQLDLWEANRMVLLNAGILESHLEVTDLCTCCNSRVLFSHRASNGKRGNLAAFMELRKF